MPYNVGDVVTIRKDLSVRRETENTPAIVYDMVEFFGTSFKIKEVKERAEGVYQYRGGVDAGFWWWTEKWLEPEDLDNREV